MNLLLNPGRAIYGLLTVLAFLCALLESLALLWGFAYAGAAGDAPGDPNFVRYSVVALTGFAGTAMLFIGVLGSSSPYRGFPIFTIAATSLLLLPLCPYAALALRGNPLWWTVLIVCLYLGVLVLSAVKLKQLRSLR